ncbi:MAG: hypothetical protein Fur0010_20770 [Bdellovibrio sp.]
MKQLECSAYRLYDLDIPDYPYAIDIYGEFAVISHFFSLIDEEEQKKGHLKETQNAITSVLNIPIEKQFVKIRTPKKGKQQYQKLSEESVMTYVHEKNARFEVNLSDYLDTGLFLDHRPMRYYIRKFVEGKSFLNLFSYTSSVTVHAVQAGARSSTSYDLSQTYLDWSRRNFELNAIDLKNHLLERVDCLKWAYSDEKVAKKYDVIFIDPPSFSNSKKMEDILDVQRDHVALIRRGMQHLNKDGVLFFSCNLRDFKLDEELKNDFKCYDLSSKTIPPDFRNNKIHQAFQFHFL